MSRVLVIRTPSGLSGDMLVAGLCAVSEIGETEFKKYLSSIGLSELECCAKVEAHTVEGISGYQLKTELPRGDEHRTWKNIRALIQNSAMSERSKKLSETTFRLLAEAEGRVHGYSAEDVTFHEVGALDSILDICVSAMLLDFISPAQVVCSPLPMGDGHVSCAHGLLTVPAPAVQEMLGNVPIYGIDAQCETVTPTALAFLHGCNAQFGSWPAMKVDRIVRSFGERIIPGVPNGAIFSLGEGEDVELNSQKFHSH